MVGQVDGDLAVPDAVGVVVHWSGPGADHRGTWRFGISGASIAMLDDASAGHMHSIPIALSASP